MNTRDYFLWFSTINELFLGEKEKLIQCFGNPNTLWNVSVKEMLDNGFNKRIADIIESSRKTFDPISVTKNLEQNDIKYVAFCDENYPERLKEIYCPPIGLFYIGELPDNNIPTVAAIGARLCSDYGKVITDRIVSELAKTGIQIVSGLAMGIDGYAHRAALCANGKTYGILGTGIDTIYPNENTDLFQKMYIKGGVISEYYLGTKNRRTNFPERNRIIAGLSDSIVVIEARKKSGTMITTDKALEQGKDVYVVPGRIGDELSEGCLQLAKHGAGIISDAADIIEPLKLRFSDYNFIHENENNQLTFSLTENIVKNVKKSIHQKFVLEKEEFIVYALLSLKPKHFEKIVIESGLDYFSVITALNGLCKKNMAVEITNETYIKA